MTQPNGVPRWKDLLEIFYAPRRVFERRRDGRLLLALVVSAVANAMLMYEVYSLTEHLQQSEILRVFGPRMMADKDTGQR